LSPDRPLDPASVTESVVVVDHYGLTDDWIAEVGAHLPVAVVDDWMRPRAAAGLVINPNVGAAPAFYDASPERCLCGADYALIRPDLNRSVDPVSDGAPGSGRVLLTLGGGDSALSLATAIDAVLAGGASRISNLEVVLGPASSIEPTPRESEVSVPVAVHRAPADFSALCRSADLVVCGASTTSHEMAYLGVAFVPVVTVANQERIGRGWEEVGLAPYLSTEDIGFAGRLGEQVAWMLASPAERRRRIALGRALVDGKGAERVLRALSRLASAGTEPGA
jgi:spore coat polysaccharide biosynthesis predicted glycosyltransferase SpsG